MAKSGRRAALSDRGQRADRHEAAAVGKRHAARGAALVMTAPQAVVFGLIGLAIALCFGLAPATSANVARCALAGGFAVLGLWRLAASVLAQGPARRGAPVHLASRIGRSRSPLPHYTILVALYREEHVVQSLVAALGRLDYPPARLQIVLLLEADDEATRAALARFPLARNFEVVLVPPGAPRTKPRALNVGLARARGEFLAIYDAEDRPHPQQLRAALDAFARAGPGCACVQAPLVIDHPRETWITGQFALEYAMHFGVLVPFLCRFRLPVPLGGTSNHFRTATLRALGGWDPYNVTEDADLGMRIAGAGWTTAFTPIPTFEEAPVSLTAFLRQRSRWQKGHIQTLLVLWRDPGRFLTGVGLRGAAAAHLALLGGVASAMAHAPFALWLIATGLTKGFDPGFALLGLFGYATTLAMAYASPLRVPHAISLLASLPVYWLLQSLAVPRALYELIGRPHHWAKTRHGAARTRPVL